MSANVRVVIRQVDEYREEARRVVGQKKIEWKYKTPCSCSTPLVTRWPVQFNCVLPSTADRPAYVIMSETGGWTEAGF